jgi:hypothetical protein
MAHVGTNGNNDVWKPTWASSERDQRQFAIEIVEDRPLRSGTTTTARITPRGSRSEHSGFHAALPVYSPSNTSPGRPPSISR